MKKILIIVGTRPEAIKLFPVYKAMQKSSHLNPLLVLTGQHDDRMLGPLFDFFELKPDANLLAMQPNQSMPAFAAALMARLDNFLSEHQPDLVVVQGDTTSCVVASLTAFYRKIKIAHVEAGLRTYNRHSPYPEEINRRITSLVTDFHYAPTEHARQHLVNEGVEGHIEVVGNTVIDSLLDACSRIKSFEDSYRVKYKFVLDGYDKLVLITGHRRENLGQNFKEIYQAIRQLAIEHPEFAFVYPLHLNPSVRSAALELLAGIKNVFLIDPVPYDEMVFLMTECYVIMTDSGGIQEEAPTLNKPIIVLRDTTERPEGIEAGCSVLVGVKTHDIIDLFDKIVNDKNVYNKMATAPNPYGSGDSSQKIVYSLIEKLIH